MQGRTRPKTVVNQFDPGIDLKAEELQEQLENSSPTITGTQSRLMGQNPD